MNIMFYGKINDLSSDYHNQNKLFKDVHKSKLFSVIISWKPSYRHVLPLFYEIMLICDVPAEGLTQGQ
jgi:hypothetical protein